jgi:hypothetical protein
MELMTGNFHGMCGYGSNLIHKFDATGKLLQTVGGKGNGEGQFSTCHGVTLDTRGKEPLLLVCDREGRRLVHHGLDLDFKGVGVEACS